MVSESTLHTEAWPDSQAPVPPGSPPSTQSPNRFMANLAEGTRTRFRLDLSPVAPVFPILSFAIGEVLQGPPGCRDSILDAIRSSKSAEH